ncbi:DUF4136 domain-containing protein [Hymenobacter sp. UYCo722]|uniref:DUF4136 domain-containing protein n=1 Tax=Hymenobacter sp. UYCo722 TaxID=3156335 RepID=UPI0033998D9B
MNRITRYLARPAALAAIGLLLLLGPSGCTTAARVGVTNDFDHAVNFRAFKTWAWYPQQPKDAEGGPAKGYESFLDKRMRAAVTTEMTAKGLTEVAVTAAPDIYVAYSARVEDKQQVSPYYNGLGYPYGYGYGYYGRGYSPVTQYKAGTVVIDIVDARRKELAWRGTGQAQVNQNTIDEVETHRIVNGILSTYPPQDNNARR